ncbi:MAG: hypothetical protein ACO1SV_25585 [Fimbriimonas sp.]
MTVHWNVGDRVVQVGMTTIYVIESFRREGDQTLAIARAQHTDERREIRIDVATPVLYKKVG